MTVIKHKSLVIEGFRLTKSQKVFDDYSAGDQSEQSEKDCEKERHCSEKVKLVVLRPRQQEDHQQDEKPKSKWDNLKICIVPYRMLTGYDRYKICRGVI